MSSLHLSHSEIMGMPVTSGN